MKTFLLSAFIALQCITVFAQQNLLNGNFEDTVAVNNQGTTVISPRHWSTSGFGAGITSDAVTGNYAAYIWNWYYYGKGILNNGNSLTTGQGGTPISFRPDLLSGYFKYIPGDVNTVNDSAVVFATLTKFNTSTQDRDTIGFGTMKFGPANTYQPFSVNINYTSSIQPDTLLVRFISSEAGFCNTASLGDCLFLYVDDLSVTSTTTGISDPVILKAFSVRPNPAKDMIYIRNTENFHQTVQIISATGQIISEMNTPGNSEVQMRITDLSAGMYFVRMSASGACEKLIIEP